MSLMHRSRISGYTRCLWKSRLTRPRMLQRARKRATTTTIKRINDLLDRVNAGRTRFELRKQTSKPVEWLKFKSVNEQQRNFISPANFERGYYSRLTKSFVFVVVKVETRNAAAESGLRSRKRLLLLFLDAGSRRTLYTSRASWYLA